MSNTNATGGVSYDKVETYKIADNQSLTVFDPLYLSSGKVAKSTDTLATNIIGFASQTKSMQTLSTVGQQEYVGVIKRGKMAFTGLVDTGSYTTTIAVGDTVSVYCDGTDYYVVNNSTNPIGQVIEGNVDTVGTATLIVEVDVSSENIKPAEVQFPFTVPTDSKIQFRDTGIYIQSSADGKLLISSDGSGADDITFTGNVTFSNDMVVDGTFSSSYHGQTFTGDVAINDNSLLKFEGIADDVDGLTLSCDASGDTSISCTAGQIAVSTKDGVVKFVDTDAATDYITLTTVAASSRQVIAAEPSGLFRFKDAGDANNSDVLDLDLTDAASANKLTSAVGFEIETTAGHITLDAAGDIYLDPAGNDVIFGVSAGKFTLGATSTSLYGGDSTGDDLKFYANSTDANPSVILNGLGAIDCLVKDQDFTVQYDTSNYLKIEIDSAGIATFTTVTGSTDGMVFVTAVGGISFTPATIVTYTLPAAGYISIDAGTTDSTAASVLSMNVDANSTNVNAIGMDVDVGTALSTGEKVNGISIDIDGNAGDHGASEMRGIFLTSANTTAGINEGISFAGTWDTGIEMNATVTTAINILIDTADDNAMKGIYISKDMAVVGATTTSASTNSALFVESINATSVAANGAMTIANNLVVITETNSAALATDDVYSGTLLALTYSATTTGAGTATTTAKAINIDYNLTETAGTLTVDDFDIINIDFDMTGTLAVADSTINMIHIDVADANTNVYGTVAMNGINIGLSTLDVSDSSLTLTGIIVTMPATYGDATEYGIYVSGDGTTVALCNDAAAAITIAGTVTTGLTIGGTLTTAISVGAASDVIVMSGNVSGSFLDMDACTGTNGQMVSTSGTAATTFAARIKVQTPDGNAGYINVYSTPNEA